MRGNLAAVLDRLTKQTTGRTEDRIAISMLRAELLYLDRDCKSAIDIFEREIVPFASTLSPDTQIAIDENLADLKLQLFTQDSLDFWNELVDRRSTLGRGYADLATIVAANDAFDRDRPAEAISLLTSKVVDCYRAGRWRGAAETVSRLARICIRAGALEEAFYYAVVGLHGDFAKPLAAAVYGSRDLTLVHRLVNRATTDAKLAMHFTRASSILTELADALGADDYAVLFEWLSPFCESSWDGIVGTSPMIAGWTLVTAVGNRWPSDIAEQFATIAIRHISWTTIPESQDHIIRGRPELIGAMIQLARAVPRELVTRIATSALPIATKHVSIADYTNTIELLCQLSARDDDVKQMVAEQLFLPGTAVNRVLGQVSGFFGREDLSVDTLQEFTERVAREISLEVQHVKDESEHIKVPETILTAKSAANGDLLMVSLCQRSGLSMLVRNKHLIPRSTIEMLVREIVRCALNVENLFSNRQSLLAQLKDLLDSVSSDLRAETFSLLLPLARPDKTILTKEPEHSLMRQGLGDEHDVQAMALVCLGRIAALDASRLEELSKVLENALTSPVAKIRRGAYAAARAVPNISEGCRLAVLMGTRDSDSSAAISAFAALAERIEWPLNDSLWRLFVLSCRSAQQTGNAVLRRHAAAALANRCKQVPVGELTNDCRDLLRTFSQDMSASVRDAVQASV